MVKGAIKSTDKDPDFEDKAAYRRIIGQLLYLTTTRPDITFAVQQLSQFMAHPKCLHYAAALRILRYLKGHPGQGLFYPSDNPLHLKAFSDLDWGTCSNTRKSVTGYCVFLGNALISWKCKKNQRYLAHRPRQNIEQWRL
jgi:hypothetical protein